jgi:excisionase family DNA binding protein
MPDERKNHAALYVRLPVAEAAKLDRAAFELKAAKQDLVAGLVARYVDPASHEGLARLRELTGADDRRRVVVEPEGEGLTVGRHSFRPAAELSVLTAVQAAELLQVEEATVVALADAGELPGRLVGDEWRFARQALLDWLGAGEAA